MLLIYALGKLLVFAILYPLSQCCKYHNDEYTTMGKKVQRILRKKKGHESSTLDYEGAIKRAKMMMKRSLSSSETVIKEEIPYVK
jgi:hypothetical protein